MQSRQGQILLASPEMDDPHFRKAVVLLIQHGPEGALGLILNRTLDFSIQEAWAAIASEADCPRHDALRFGGPCDGPLMALHRQPEYGQFDVLPSLYFTTDRDHLSELVMLPEMPIRFFAGYSGWGGGQLESELATGSWLLTHADADAVFDSGDDLWTRLLARVDPTLAMLARNPRIVPPDPSLN